MHTIIVVQSINFINKMAPQLLGSITRVCNDAPTVAKLVDVYLVFRRHEAGVTRVLLVNYLTKMLQPVLKQINLS